MKKPDYHPTLNTETLHLQNLITAWQEVQHLSHTEYIQLCHATFQEFGWGCGHHPARPEDPKPFFIKKTLPSQKNRIASLTEPFWIFISKEGPAS